MQLKQEDTKQWDLEAESHTCGDLAHHGAQYGFYHLQQRACLLQQRECLLSADALNVYMHNQGK